MGRRQQAMGSTVMNTLYENWLNYMNSQIGFYKNKNFTKRTDDEYDWAWYYSILQKNGLARLKNVIKTITKYTPGQDWFNERSELLFGTRQILEDEYSKLQFDLYVLLRIVGDKRFFPPRSHFDDFLLIQKEEEFTLDLPKDYGGFPLKTYSIKINNSSQDNLEANIVTFKLFFMFVNKWRQYLIKRTNLNMVPSNGEVVFDCGSCIGDISLIFAACVGASGEVHLFDPVPLHNRYSQIQADLNPLLKNVFRINQQAVGETEKKITGVIEDVSKIVPGGCGIDNFEVATIDNYSRQHRIKMVNYIKMDIEGAEAAALRGAASIIGSCKPKLAISAYHKQEDLWELPMIIKELNPEYKIYFEHHLPIYWESCFYAV